MKWSRFCMILVFSTGTLLSCSSDSGKEEPGSTSSAASSDTTNTVDAKEKKPDAIVQGLKGKVEVMSETTYAPGASGKFTSKNVFKYDENGNRIELSNYRPGGKINSTVKSTYDAGGKLIKEETVLADGTVDVSSEIKTDAKGNRIEQQDIRPAAATNLFNYKYYFNYDAKGQVTERVAYRGNGTFLFKYSFSYDANGNKTEWTQIGSDSTVVGKIIYKYDDKNHLVEEFEYGKGNSLKATYTYTYEFDKKNNWIRQTKRQNNKAIEIKEREITYH